MSLTGSERWVPVEGYEGLYEVSDTGKVKSLARRVEFHRQGKPSYFTTRERLLRTSGGEKYRMVILCKGGEKKPHLVHRLVAQAFIPNPERHPFVLHGDDNPQNNNVENLRWGTHSDNMLDSIRNGTHHEARKTRCKRGHEFTPENTRIRKTKTGESRWCRECGRRYRREGLPNGDERHGTATGYYNYGCRCDRCRDAMRVVEGVKNPWKVKSPTCKRGHPRTEENIYTDKRGARHCKPCAALRARNNRLEAGGGAIKYEVNGE